ncbi:MAG: acetoin utilization protein [Methylothermaceae bacteria B42]|nr:MAG: acetoin utilization protein [Methylothermaceae bacteria B42]HHJ38491.1 histone deacetylase family protein [Methylothermaceae bacterium]
MTTLLYSHPDCLKHDTGPGHPERSARLEAILKALEKPQFKALTRLQAPEATMDQLSLIHPELYIDAIFKAIPKSGYHYLDPDTVVSPGSGVAALRAAGAVCAAVDQVMAGKANNAFCAIRPPGHHAKPSRAMGFCLFNNVAIAASHAITRWRIDRVAIVDFDVHHGNGTQAAFEKKPKVLYASTHQFPFYPGTGSAEETGVGNLVNVPLPAGTDGSRFRQAVSDRILPAIRHFKPQLLLVSAGFDGHKQDPLASWLLEEEDYVWITRQLLDFDLPLVSSLEGGYHLEALAASVASHVQALLQARPMPK